MKKTILLFLVMTMIFSTLCGVTVSADEAASITLSRNKTFITSVDTTSSLIVTALDANGNEAELPAGTTFAYESTRPWVLDIAEDGKFIDGGYDGTTTVTVTASNGMKASVIFIKNTDNVYANTSYVTAETTDNDTIPDGVGTAGLRFRGTWIDDTYQRGRVNVNSETATEAEKAAAKIPGENYFRMPVVQDDLTADGKIVSGYDAVKNQEAVNNKQSWYKEGLRVMQGWFYDDGTGPVHMRSFMAETDSYLSGALTGSLGSNISHFYWQADIKAETGADTYSMNYTHAVTDNKEYTIKRSKGWHQATTVLNDDMTIDVFIDGELLSSSKSAVNEYVECKFYLACCSVGNFDELVVAANPNTTKPETYQFPAESISLSKNTTFYSSAVPEGTELVVTPIDAYGDEGALSNPDYEYESSRPWVIDVRDGKLYDGGYDGSTTITVTEKNSGFTASLIFIKSASDTAVTSGFTNDSALAGSATAADGYAYYGVRGTVTTANEDAFTRVEGEPYIASGGSINYKGSWDKEAKIRIAQSWFYDDLSKDMDFYMTLGAVNPRTYYYSDYGTENQALKTEITDGTNGFIPAWAQTGLDETLHSAMGSSNAEKGYYINGLISASSSPKGQQKDVSYYAFSDNRYDSPVKRTKGWHQATLILNDDATVELYIDGVSVNDTQALEQKLKSSNHSSIQNSMIIMDTGKVLRDDLVFAQNLNTTRPIVNISVSYDDTKGTVSCNNNSVANGGKVEAYYDGSVNFTFAPKEGYELDTVTYDGTDVTAFIKNDILSVDCKNAELAVTFKEVTPVAPTVAKTVEIKTDEKVDGYSAALMYMQIQSGKGYTVTDTGIVISDKENNAENGLKLTALNQDKTNVTSGMFGIRVYGEGLNGIKCYYRPFITYQKDGQTQTDYNGTEESFKLPEKE